jgi:hypothetical protein
MNGIPPSADRPFPGGAALAPPLKCPRPAAAGRRGLRDGGAAPESPAGRPGAATASGAAAAPSAPPDWPSARSARRSRGKNGGVTVSGEGCEGRRVSRPCHRLKVFQGGFFILVIHIVAFLADLAIKTGFTCRRFRADFFPSISRISPELFYLSPQIMSFDSCPALLKYI